MLCFFRFIKSDLFRKFVINILEFFYRNKRMKRVTKKIVHYATNCNLPVRQTGNLYPFVTTICYKTH